MKCKKEKPWAEFALSKSRRPFGLASNCLQCDAERKKNLHVKWRVKNPELAKARGRDKNLKQKFGLSAAEYDEMFEQQKGLCAICQKPERYIHHYTRQPSRLAVDHDHSTGEIRQLLCASCNHGLGNFLDNPDLLQKAIEYLAKHSPTEKNDETL